MELGPEDVSLLERCPHFKGILNAPKGKIICCAP